MVIRMKVYQKMLRGEFKIVLTACIRCLQLALLSIADISVESVIKTQALTYLGSDAIDVGLADKVVSTIEFIEKLSHTSGVNY